jgi:hypothetical protein
VDIPQALAPPNAPAAFDRDDAFHEVRANLGDEPAKRAAGRVRHDDRRTDLVEQHRAALTPHHVLAVRAAGGHAGREHRGRRLRRARCTGAAPAARRVRPRRPARQRAHHPGLHHDPPCDATS